MADKTFSEWEIETGLFAINEAKAKGTAKMSRADFDEKVQDNINDFTGVNYKDRVAFLKANKYPLTRGNLINADLSSIPQTNSKKK